MISPELIRRYPFFGGLSNDHIVALANAGEEIAVSDGEQLFKEGDTLDAFYLLLEGEVLITMDIPDRGKEQPVSKQLTGEKLHTREVETGVIEEGQVFAWSAIVPPYEATANGKANGGCKLIAFDAAGLREAIEQDYHLGYLLSQRAAQVLRQRMQSLRIESLAYS
jgi:CRP-like cAMP-binding protein